MTQVLWGSKAVVARAPRERPRSGLSARRTRDKCRRRPRLADGWAVPSPRGLVPGAGIRIGPSSPERVPPRRRQGFLELAWDGERRAGWLNRLRPSTGQGDSHMMLRGHVRSAVNSALLPFLLMACAPRANLRPKHPTLPPVRRRAHLTPHRDQLRRPGPRPSPVQCANGNLRGANPGSGQHQTGCHARPLQREENEYSRRVQSSPLNEHPPSVEGRRPMPRSRFSGSRAA